MQRQSILLLAILVFNLPVEAKIKRSHKAIAMFKHQYACPSSGMHKGKCLGYVIDHVEPLCAGGVDAPINMQWQPILESKVKDKLERKLCRKAH